MKKDSNMMASTSNTMGWIICGLAAVFYCYEYLLRIQPSVMVNELMRQYHISADRFSAIVSLYYLAYTPMQIIVGLITDLYGPRYILTFAVFICTVGSFLFGVADHLYIASIGRFLVGFGSAFAFVSALKLASVWLPLNRFALFAGLVTALGMIGGMVGDIGMTYLVHTMGWKGTIYASTVLGAILVPLIWFIIREKPAHPDGLSEARRVAAYRETFSGLREIVSNPQVWIGGIAGGFLYLSLTVFGELWGIPFLKTVYQLNASQAAFTNSFVFFGWLVGAPLTGWTSDKLGKRKSPLLIGLIFSLIIVSIVIYLPQIPISMLNVLLFLFGVFSSLEVVSFALGREASPRHVSGAAVSFINLLVMLGGLIFQPLVGRLLDSHWTGQMTDGIRLYDSTTFQFAMMILPLSLLLGIVLTLFLKETHAR